MATWVSQGQSRQIAEEEARAEVDVLNSRLEKTAQLTRKIQATLAKLEGSGKSVGDLGTPSNVESKRLQTVGSNVDAVLAAIGRLRPAADTRNDEEAIIRLGPDKAGLSNYLSSIKRLNNSLGAMKASNLRSNQQAVQELDRLIISGNTQLESCFERLLRGETPRSVEPLHFITKEKPFPVISQDKVTRLGLINSYVGGYHRSVPDDFSSQESSSITKVYYEIRSSYLSASLANLAAASVSMAKKRPTDVVYRLGSNGIGAYTTAIEGMFLAEYENICNIFTREDWGPVFQSTCQSSLSELSRTLRELNACAKSNPSMDCYLAFETYELVSNLSGSLETRTGELKAALGAALRPIRETAKQSLIDLLDDTKRRVATLPVLSADGAPVPIVTETMQRLQGMVDFLRPISSIMISLGDGGWRSSLSSSNRSADQIPSLSSFDIAADGRELFAHYCVDTIDALLATLEQRAKLLLKSKAVMGVLVANSVVTIDRMIRASDLGPLLEHRMGILDQWRKTATMLYTDSCKDLSFHLFDAIHTNRSQRPASTQPDSAMIIKNLTGKDKDSLKGKFAAFNVSFEDLVARHKAYAMDRDVRQMFARDLQQMLEPLYNRFWDRYHDVDRGRAKYVKYDKAAISVLFASLY